MPVAAILVASIRLHFLDIVLNAAARGPTALPCDVSVRKGDELGWFEHGSTIIVLAPDHFEFCDNVVESGADLRRSTPDAKIRRWPNQAGLKSAPSISIHRRPSYGSAGSDAVSIRMA